MTLSFFTEVIDIFFVLDVRDLIQLEDAMEDEHLHFGPNGGLIFCMEYGSTYFFRLNGGKHQLHLIGFDNHM